MIASTTAIAAFATAALAAAFSLSDNFSFLSIASSLASITFWISSNAFSFPTGFSASIASLPVVFALSTSDCPVAVSIAFLASSTILLTCSLTACFSASESLSLPAIAFSLIA